MSLAGHDTDASLVTALNAGDRSAFETIYRKYIGDLYGCAARNISRKEDCEEIVHDVFESLWVRRDSVRIEVSLRGYLLKMVKHKIFNYFRDKGIHKRYEEHFMLFEAVYSDAADEKVNAAVIEERMEKLIAQLPDRCQVALRLRLREELSNREIARRMNVATKTVEVYMFRAFNHIRANYHAYSNTIILLFLTSCL